MVSSRASWLKPCRRKAPNENDCLRHSFQTMFPALAVGIPEIGMPRFEPLFIDKIAIQKGQGAVTISGSFQNILAHGPSNSTTSFVNLDLENKRLDFGIDIPELRIEADYDMKGNILLLPLVGNGEAKLKFTNTTTSGNTKIEIRKGPDGREIMHVVSMDMEFLIRGMQVHLSNLFNGNKVLGLTVNSFLNRNSQQVVDDLKEPISASLSVVFLRLINQLFHHVPMDLWLTE
ncbi:circadian clock-controlled protein daywake-like [Anabrus simplex]|uniref:circadian clock-controlled protein daywake-like n=1 Tax=Anabrus simplex TaxID=316456 RepID=UPI0035A2B913